MNIKVRLALMNFLEFAVWGAYLTSMGNYLGRAGMGAEISWFYAIQGIVSIFMPTLMGIVADRLIQPQRLLGYCHLVAGVFMVSLFMMGMNSATPDKTIFMTCTHLVWLSICLRLRCRTPPRSLSLRTITLTPLRTFRLSAYSELSVSSQRCGS